MYNFDKIPSRLNTNSEKWSCDARVLPMWVADMDFDTAPKIKEYLVNRATLGALGYSYVSDDLFLSYINFWKRHHGFTFEKEWMIFATGVVASISSIVRKITTVGENVLVMAPVYNIFYNCIYNNGRNIISSDLVYKNGIYEIDFDDLEKKLSDPQTTLLILCNPHNPVGKIWTHDELLKIGKLAKKYNVTVLSDEIHCDIVRKGLKYTPFASVSDECLKNSITLIAPSKCFNIAGLNSSMVVVYDKALRHKVWRGLNTDECAEPNVFAVGATIAAFNECDDWLNEVNDYIDENINYVCSFIKENIPSLYVCKCDATYLLWIDCAKATDDSDDFAAFLKNETGLWVSSGKVYGKNAKTFIRLNVATSKENVKDGLNRLKDGTLKYMQK